MKNIKNILASFGSLTLSEVPAGFDALILADIARAGEDVLFVARDEARAVEMAGALAFFAPELAPMSFPAWDCLPYDRVSPNGAVVSRRIETLVQLASGAVERPGAPGRVILSTVSALLQRVPPPETFRDASFSAQVGQRIGMDPVIEVLTRNGYHRSDTVMEPGEFAVRGGILDVFPTGAEYPVRLDFFGDELDGLRQFDPISQRTSKALTSVVIKPVSEVLLHDDAVARFRTQYRELFGAVGSKDLLYEAVSAGRRHIGMEHWLPLFHERLVPLYAHLPGARVVLDHEAIEARDARLEQISDYHGARETADVASGKGAGLGGQPPYRPVPSNLMYLDEAEWDADFGQRATVDLTPFAQPEREGESASAGGHKGHDSAEARANPDLNLYDAVGRHMDGLIADGHRVVIACWSEGSRERLEKVLNEHKAGRLTRVDDLAAVMKLPKSAVALAVLALEHGFVGAGLAVITEADILGDRLVRPSRRRLRAENFIAEATSLNEGDLVVHVDHGIGRYEGLEALAVSGAPHDCLCVVYDGGDKLFVPVENIEVLSRYGSDQGVGNLDKLGGVAWQARKSRMKDRIRDIADQLIKVAAARELRVGEAMLPAEGLFDEFCARFPYVETDDQLRAIADITADLGSGRPMDRLVCGDVGFGKTEVALRAAFITAMTGTQVAIVVPTTLLARQHYKTFVDRFAGFPIRIEQLSRMVSGKSAKLTKDGMVDGTVDVVIGTHALLAKSIKFGRLGLLVIDEEQHFGVTHKERLKQLKSDVHVLTLTATPIPRTLQMALSGVREMSLIATPPIDRLAVRTFVMPFDPVVIREALMREHFRGGQTFYVCPRIADLDQVAGQLIDLVPELKVGIAHGRLSPNELDDMMNAFSEGAFDVLLSTNIVESGLDLPTANTLVIHRADMFGLSQLYQLRGRVGRSKTRAYAYLTLPLRQTITPAASKRLDVMQSLDTLGAGFSLASYDLDIRGAGNLLGEEQSGQIREVGVELYQRMLEEAVAEARGLDTEEAQRDTWSPQINLGMPVLIPDTYVADLGVRMALYRRLADFADQQDIEAFAVELVDRFGSLPGEAENLLEVVGQKLLCRQAGIEKVDVGPKGAVITFRNNTFANPAGLVHFITSQTGTAKLRPDHKLVFMRAWDDPERRATGARQLLTQMAELTHIS